MKNVEKSNTSLEVVRSPGLVAVAHTHPRCWSCLSQSYSPTTKVGAVALLYTAIHFAL
jgi:hypothetical protein